MKEERMLILSMLQEGKITAEEAHDLLEALAFGQEASNEQAAEQWEEVKSRLERAGDVVEERLEQAREKIEERMEDVRVRIDAARDKAGHDPESPIQGLEDVFVTVERGLAQFAKELPEAIGRLVSFDFGSFAGHTVEHVYEGTFHEGTTEAAVSVETRNGSVKWETWDEPGYRVVVTNKVRAEDKEQAELKAADATVWEKTDTGFHLKAGVGRGIASSVRVLLPVGVRCHIDTKTRNGSIRAREVAMNSGKFTTSNGSIRMEDVDAHDMQTTTTNGSIRIAGIVETLRGTTAQGSIEVRLPAYGDRERHIEQANWNLRTTNGSIRIRMPEAADVGFHMDLQTVNGRVRSSIPGLDAEVSGRHPRSVIWQSAGYEQKSRQVAVTASTVNGSISVTAGEEGV